MEIIIGIPTDMFPYLIPEFQQSELRYVVVCSAKELDSFLCLFVINLTNRYFELHRGWSHPLNQIIKLGKFCNLNLEELIKMGY